MAYFYFQSLHFSCGPAASYIALCLEFTNALIVGPSLSG
jgi:hypothetical protein